jgi:hypothetical protein
VNWSTLTLAEVAGLFAAAGAVALWLYLRQPRAARLRVSTLRFWESSPSGSSTARRWKLREPWAFIAQLLFLLFLIAALGNPRWGVVTQGRNVAIVLDAGAWSQMHDANGATWLDSVRSRAGALLRELPSDDRIVLLRADSDGAPMVPFTTDRNLLRLAVANMQASSAVADVPRALAQGRAALGESVATPSGVRRGLLVYIGPGLVDDKQARELDDFRASLELPTTNAQASEAATIPPEFLVRLMSTPTPLQDIGITQIALKRNAGAPDEWSVMTRIKNYNNLPAKVLLSLSVGGHVFQQVPVSIAAGATESANDDFTSRSGGLLQAEIAPTDGLEADNRATIDLPSSEPVSVTVVTSRAAFANKMRAVLSANPYVKTQFLKAGENPPATADVVVCDGSAPAGATNAATISFIPAGSDNTGHRVRLTNWNTAHPVTRWIQSRDVTVRAAHSVHTRAGDIVLASSSGDAPEPLIVARQESRRRSVLVDFDPLDSNFTEEAAFPLLMAASVEWMTHTVQEQGDFLVSGPVDLPQPISRVVAPSGREVLFAGDDSSIHFFAGESGLYRITSAGQNVQVPVNVPLLPTIRMAPTSTEAAPLAPQPVPIEQQELWRWLVVLAMIALWLEWRFFYVRREKSTEPGGQGPLSLGGTGITTAQVDRESESAAHTVKTS